MIRLLLLGLLSAPVHAAEDPGEPLALAPAAAPPAPLPQGILQARSLVAQGTSPAEAWDRLHLEFRPAPAGGGDWQVLQGGRPLSTRRLAVTAGDTRTLDLLDREARWGRLRTGLHLGLGAGLVALGAWQVLDARADLPAWRDYRPERTPYLSDEAWAARRDDARDAWQAARDAVPREEQVRVEDRTCIGLVVAATGGLVAVTAPAVQRGIEARARRPARFYAEDEVRRLVDDYDARLRGALGEEEPPVPVEAPAPQARLHVGPGSLALEVRF